MKAEPSVRAGRTGNTFKVISVAFLMDRLVLISRQITDESMRRDHEAWGTHSDNLHTQDKNLHKVLCDCVPERQQTEFV